MRQNLLKQPGAQQRTFSMKGVLTAFLTVATLSLFGFASLLTPQTASAKTIKQLPHEPNNPKILQVYFNTTDNHEYIYNGEEWVPHDASIDTYVLKKYKKSKVLKDPAAGKNGSKNNASPSTNQGGSK